MSRLNLSQMLRDGIAASGKSQSALAREAGISQPVLSDFLAHKKDMYLETANKILNVIPSNPIGASFMRWRKIGSVSVAVIMVPAINGERFVVLTKHCGWVLRDFIFGRELYHPPEQSNLAQIEAEVTNWGPVPYLSITAVDQWKCYLEMLTTAVTGKKTLDRKTEPNGNFGHWRDF